MSDARIGGGGTTRVSVFDTAMPLNGGFEPNLTARIPVAALPEALNRFAGVLANRSYTVVNTTTTTTPSPTNVAAARHFIQFF
jgi:hypothetical protein